MALPFDIKSEYRYFGNSDARPQIIREVFYISNKLYEILIIKCYLKL